ncbi:hypothetical protein LZ30DRAFT_217945 [Colletotrichum cereale]|nr:hypothetical protein LZ30DRAFT_217945 [Colletotrichum cereale]
MRQKRYKNDGRWKRQTRRLRQKMVPKEGMGGLRRAVLPRLESACWFGRTSGQTDVFVEDGRSVDGACSLKIQESCWWLVVGGWWGRGRRSTDARRLCLVGGSAAGRCAGGHTDGKEGSGQAPVFRYLGVSCTYYLPRYARAQATDTHRHSIHHLTHRLPPLNGWPVAESSRITINHVYKLPLGLYWYVEIVLVRIPRIYNFNNGPLVNTRNR